MIVCCQEMVRSRGTTKKLLLAFIALLGLLLLDDNNHVRAPCCLNGDARRSFPSIVVASVRVRSCDLGVFLGSVPGHLSDCVFEFCKGQRRKDVS